MTLETLQMHDTCGVNDSWTRCSSSATAHCRASVPLYKAQFGPKLGYNRWVARFRGLPQAIPMTVATWLPPKCVRILHLDTRQMLVFRLRGLLQQSKLGRGAGWPRKQVELLKRENRSLKQVVCRLRGLVRLLTAELQAKIDETRAKTSVLNSPKRELAARRATERGVVSLADGYKCALLRRIGHAGADAVVDHLDASIARQTEFADGSRC